MNFLLQKVLCFTCINVILCNTAKFLFKIGQAEYHSIIFTCGFGSLPGLKHSSLNKAQQRAWFAELLFTAYTFSCCWWDEVNLLHQVTSTSVPVTVPGGLATILSSICPSPPLGKFLVIFCYATTKVVISDLWLIQVVLFSSSPVLHSIVSKFLDIMLHRVMCIVTKHTSTFPLSFVLLVKQQTF